MTDIALARTVLRGMGIIVLATPLAGWPVANAQTAAEPAFDEEIVVTGSRIRRDPLDARESVLGMEADDRGFPADGGGVAAGASQVDLRHLGSKRVLVLVDGVRWVNGSSGSGVSGATDLNTIPACVIERVEVLRDGVEAVDRRGPTSKPNGLYGLADVHHARRAPL